MNLALRSLEQVPRDQIPEVLGALERVRAVLWGRWAAPDPEKRSEGQERPEEARLLTAGEAAERLGVSRRWVYNHRKQIGGIKVGGKVRVPEDALADYLAAQRPGGVTSR